jgi:predicted nucleic acid-binding Zn ribbon protein
MNYVDIGTRPLPAATPHYPCLTCGAAIPDKGRETHAEWHRATAEVAIETARRVERLEVA